MYKSIKAKDLNDEEQEEFFEEFYCLTPEWLNDEETPHPWGAPWHFPHTIYLEGNTVKQMARNYYESVIGEIERLYELDQQERL